MSYLKRRYRHLVEDPSYLWMKALARFELARELAKRSTPTSEQVADVEVGEAREQNTDAGEATREQNTAAALPARVTADHGFVGALSLLDREGYYVGLRITRELLTDLLRRIESATCYGDGETDVPFEADRRVQAEQHYQRVFQRGSYLNQHEHWPEFLALRADPGLSTLATHYLGRPPVYLRSEVAWTYPRSVDSERPLGTPPPFECDIQGFRSLTFTFYLTDVGAGDGPHTYIKKTPQKRPLAHQLLGRHCAGLSEEHLTRTYGSEQMVTVYGPRGLGFVGDPYYLHRSGIPTRRAHLLLQMQFGCRRYRTDFH